MMTKAEFIRVAKANRIDVSLVEDELQNFDRIIETALDVQAAMPGIGFVSIKQRLNCFMAVCRHLDSLVEGGDLTMSEVSIILGVLKLKDRRFGKAIAAFEMYADRYGVRERAEMPRTARSYLAVVN